MTSKMETLSFQFSVPFLIFISCRYNSTKEKLYNVVVFSLISSCHLAAIPLPQLSFKAHPDASLLPSRTAVFD